MKPIRMRYLVIALVVMAAVVVPAAVADGARQAGARTPTATPRFLRLSPMAPTRTPRVTASPIAGQGAMPTPTLVSLTPTPREPGATPTATVPTRPLQPTPRVTSTPGALPETGIEPQPGGPLSDTYGENLLQNLRQLESFRYESMVTWDLDTGRSGEADVVTEVTNQPPAQRWELDIRQPGRSDASYEIVRVEGQTYMNVAGQWREVMPSVEALANRFPWIVDLQAYLDLSEGIFVGTETVNGIEVERYRYFSDAFDPTQGPFEIEGARADLWIDREREILVRARMLLVGADPLGGSGAYTIDSTLMAMNPPLTIEAPPVAAPEELPRTGPTALILADALKLPMFDTYRLDGTIRWQIETGERGSASFDVAVDQQRPAERAEIDLGQGFLRMSFTYLNIEGVAYVQSGDRWVPAEQFALPALVEQLGWIGDPRGFVAQGEGRMVGRETVNGVRTEHYVFERDALGSLPFLAEVEDGQVDAWYAPEYDAYVRLNAQLEGVDNRDVRAVYELESEVSDINAPISIERPADFPEE